MNCCFPRKCRDESSSKASTIVHHSSSTRHTSAMSGTSGPAANTPEQGQLVRRRSWNQLRDAAKETRRQQMSVASRVPSSFVFRRDAYDVTKIRLYFLGMHSNNRENSIMYVDVPESDGNTFVLPWKPLLDSFQATPFMGQYSKEEQLLRERKRLGTIGITMFDVDLNLGKFIFPACNSLFYCTDKDFVQQPIFPTNIKSSCTGARMDPKICPVNGDLVAFIHNNDIWITHTASGCEKRLTFVHKGGASLRDDPHSAGVPSFVMQEEFDRYTGYWWQPVSTKYGTYRLVYEEVDESDVEIISIQSADGRGVDEYRYPKAGSPNARSTLRVLEFCVDSNGVIKDDVDYYSLAQPLSCLFPWLEYVVRVDWTPDGQHVWAQLLNRQQNRISLILIPLDSFVSEQISDNQQDPIIYVLYEETSNVWINMHDLLYFFGSVANEEVSFLWASEESGFRHLYRITSELRKNDEFSTICHVPRFNLDMSSDSPVSPQVVAKVALTSGEWEVNAKQLWVDEVNKIVYFVSLKETPLETHLCAVRYDYPGEVSRLTQLGYSHFVQMDSDCQYFITLYSNITTPPAADIYQISDVRVVPKFVARLMEAPPVADYQPPNLFNFTSSSGQEFYGMIYIPRGSLPSCKYPTVQFVYGGPEVQLVTNSYKGVRFLRLQMLASLGYVVVVIDNRGSSHRGLNFEGHIRWRMGVVEIDDQVEGLQWLAANLGYIDLSRIAIHGWSYGGYLSLMGLAQRPDIYKLAIAGAPVTCWMAYDTGYTERYMDTPQNNPEGYKSGSVLEYANRFPSTPNKLLIVHGLMDENVHFLHTCMLINSLIRACKPYCLQVYPNERHGIRYPDASEHYETLILNFLQQNL